MSAGYAAGSVLDMWLASVALALVALGSLGVCAAAIVLLARNNAATLDLLDRTLRAGSDNLSRAHGSLGMAMTEVASKTAGAIGDAVFRSMTPVAPPQSTREAAYAVARDVLGSGEYHQTEPDDLMNDPTDWAIAPEREDLAVVGANDRSPTGIPGFAFDMPDLTGVSTNGG